MRGSATLATALDELSRVVERVAARTFGSLGPLWRWLYLATARAVARHLRRADRGAAVLLRGSVASEDAVYGMSDLDLVAVAADDSRADALRIRWERVAGAVPPLRRLVDVAFHGEGELARAAASTCLTYGLSGWTAGAPAATYHGRARSRDATQVLMRAEDPADWQVLAGPDRRPPPSLRGAADRRIAAWLEIQSLWRQAFDIAPSLARSDAARICVKLLAEPTRIYLSLTSGEMPRRRRDMLERATEAFPEHGSVLGQGIALLEDLHRRPEAPLRAVLPFLVDVTAAVAGILDADARATGATEVRLVGGAERLALPTQGAADVLPLVDWWARTAVARLPDEVFAPVEGDPGDLDDVLRALSVAPDGLYVALRGPGMLVLPAPPADAVLRAVQSSTTDPVSFALLEGAEVARFPRLAGFSAEDSARRAVAEHAAWLERHPRGGRKELDALAMLLSAARAALFVETLADGAPELPLTLAATARMLAEPVAEEAFEDYARCLREGARPDRRIATALETTVRELPVYRPLLDRAAVAA